MKTFDVKLKVGDCIQLFENAFMTMMRIPIATGTVTQVRGPNDGFVFDCVETGSSEVIAEGDGTVKILKMANAVKSSVQSKKILQQLVKADFGPNAGKNFKKDLFK